jgi:nicotinate phosphoribosyltransferase
MKLFIADEEDVRNGYTMDVYFERTMRILEAKGLSGIKVWAEFTAGSLPSGWPWAVFCGSEEVLRLMESRDVDIFAIPEGTIFRARNPNSVRIPVMNIHGSYGNFGEMETAALGMMCHPSGVATAAARTKFAARGKTVIAFGNRRMHPAIAGMLDRSAYIGGCDAVSSRMGADIIGQEPMGTIPHSLMLLIGSNAEAFKAFDETIERSVPRIMLIDTFSDERVAAMEACRTVRDLKGVRLDTPGSRRGNFRELIQEIRWELDMNGYKGVEIIVSGGLNENSVRDIADTCVSGFGVGTSISNAPTLDISMDIVEKEGEPISKRGKFGGRKFAYRCPDCLLMDVSLSNSDDRRCVCGSAMVLLEEKVMEAGKRTGCERTPSEVRRYVLAQLKQLREL